MPRIVVLVSGGGTNLQSLIDAGSAKELGGGEIAAVIASRDNVFALERARKASVPAITVARKAFASSADFCTALDREVSVFNPDLIVCAGFLCVLDSAFCEKYSGKIINIHPSLIPSFCGKGMYGLHVHEAVLAYGVKITGATVHFVNNI
ncbi:MAG: phosphoribosylglycinamide formyltransferase, partial [Oscillospiraceae bacterium]